MTPAWARRLRWGLVGFVLVVCLVGIIVLAFDVRRRIDDGATAQGDAVQWTLSQADVELLALDVAVHDGMYPAVLSHHPHDRIEEIRRRFDVLYSRVQTLAQGQLFAELRNDPEFEANLDRVRQFLVVGAPMIDATDTELLTNLPRLHIHISELREPVRAMALAGLRTFAAISERNRTQVARTLLIMAALTVVFIVTLLAMVALLLRLDLAHRARTAEARASAARLAAIVGTAQDAVITLDTHGRIVDRNGAAERMFCHDPSSAMGREMAKLLFREADRPALRAALSRALNRREPSGDGRLRLEAHDRSGRSFPVEISVSATSPSEGPRLLVAFLRDLTDQVAAEAALVKARDEALAGERAKADLLAVMSHEVRTPLNGLLGTLEMLARTRLTAQQKDYLRILDASGRLLLHHVNDVLDISRLDGGHLKPVAAPLDLGLVAREVADNQAAAAAARGNAIVLDLPQDGRMGLVSDAQLLKQVLLNLVGNAVKFTDGGRITLAITHQGAEGPTEFRVTDTGQGIAPEDLSRIFDDFVTLDPSYARRQGGTGLGLGIARRLVASLGGTLEVESVLGAGSSFHFRLNAPILDAVLPQARAEGRSAPDAPAPQPTPLPARAPTRRSRKAPAAGGLAILMVEDNEINRIVLGEMLTRQGHAVTEAPDGQTALRLAGQQRFDVILMDISMPGMDGLAATDAIRQIAGPNQATPILALTAHALPEEQARFRAHGMADVLVKPLSADDLAEVLQRLRQPATAQAPRRRKPAAQPPAQLAHLVPAFLAEGDRALEEIGRLASDPEGGEALRKAVHRLAGSAGLIGAGALSRQLGRIETALKTGETAKARAEIAALPDLWAETLVDLQGEKADAPLPSAGSA